MTDTLKDLSGRIIGYVDVKPNGDKTLKDQYGKIKGWYYKQQNVTKNQIGKIVYYGDCLTMLLNDK